MTSGYELSAEAFSHDNYSRDLLREGILEAKTGGDRQKARRYLDRALYTASDPEVMAEGWFWMSQVTDDPAEKRKTLENCLLHDFNHLRARRALAILDGRLKPEEIVNPDALPPAPKALSRPEAQRFICPKCGGRMTFAPDGGSIVCEYCARDQTLNPSSSRAEVRDFLVAMATVRGHRPPLAEQVIQCQGCGAQFILPPGELSLTCAYCGSAHVINLEKSKDLLAPDGILPHRFDRKHAVALLVKWVEDNQLRPEKKVDWPRALYLPVWSFDLGGGIDYEGTVLQKEDDSPAGRVPGSVSVSDRYPVLIHDFLIPASRKLSAPFLRLLPTFDFKTLQPYDPRYLADWPAELYDLPLADASLDARQQAYALLKRDLADRVHPVTLSSSSSANMTIESFRLDLLPVWMTEIWHENRSHLALINGQTGFIQCDILLKPAGGLIEWLGDLLKD